jgi:hypothetical protein
VWVNGSCTKGVYQAEGSKGEGLLRQVHRPRSKLVRNGLTHATYKGRFEVMGSRFRLLVSISQDGTASHWGGLLRTAGMVLTRGYHRQREWIDMKAVHELEDIKESRSGEHL